MNVIEIDAASNNGVDNIRQIREEVAYRPPSPYYIWTAEERRNFATATSWARSVNSATFPLKPSA